MGLPAMAKFFTDRFSAFKRASVAYDAAGTSCAVDLPRYQNGGLLIEEGTTVVPSNPFFVDGVADWGLYVAAAASATKAKVVGGSYGGYVCEVNIANGAIGKADVHIYKSIGAVTANTKVGGKVRIKASSNATQSITILRNDNPYTAYASVNINVTTNWQEFEIVATVTETVTTRIAINLGGTNGIIFDIDYVCCEIGKDYSTSPTIGTRAAETFVLPGAILNPDEWTVDMLVYVTPALKSTMADRYLFAATDPKYQVSVSQYDFAHTTEGKWRFRLQRGTRVVYLDYADNLSTGLHLFRCKNTPGEAALYIDGVKVGYTAAAQTKNIPGGQLYLGSFVDGTGQMSAPIVDFRISAERPDGDAVDGLTAGALTTDEYTVFRLPFDSALTTEVPIPRMIAPVDVKPQITVSETWTGKYFRRDIIGVSKRVWTIRTGLIRKALLYGLNYLYQNLVYGSIAEYFWFFDFGTEGNRVKVLWDMGEDKIQPSGTSAAGWDVSSREKEITIKEQ